MQAQAACRGDANLQPNPNQYLFNREWVLQRVIAGNGPKAPPNKQVTVRFNDRQRITSNFLTNCYRFQWHSDGKLLITNDCVFCGCPPDGCSDNLPCNQDIWKYKQPDNNTLILEVTDYFTGIYISN